MRSEYELLNFWNLSLLDSPSPSPCASPDTWPFVHNKYWFPDLDLPQENLPNDPFKDDEEAREKLAYLNQMLRREQVEEELGGRNAFWDWRRKGIRMRAAGEWEE